jgi:hypothetical protein
MAASENDNQSSLALLEQRLRRLEFLLTGSSDLDGNPDGINVPAKSDDTVAARVARLENGLDRLRRLNGPAGEIVRDIQAICMNCDSCRTVQY